MVAAGEASLVLTLDAGGSGVKAGVLSVRDWQVLGTALREYRVSYPEPGHAEFDPQSWWAAMVDAAAEVVARVHAPPGRYLGITCTAMRIPFVLLDDAGEPIVPGVLNLDARGRPYLDEVRAALGGDALYRLTGHWPATPLGLPKLLWFKHRRPDVWAGVRRILQMHDWMLYELSGEVTGEPSSAAMGQIVDVAQRRWATDLLSTLGIDPALFPPLRDAGTVVGGLKPVVARAMGLLPGTPVHVGAGDTHLSCLGVDGVEVGTAVIVAGSTTPIQFTAAEPACDMAARPWVSPHVWPDRWAVEMNVGATGMLYTWLRDLCRDLGGMQAGPDYAALDALAASSPRGARDLLVTAPQPHWGEDAWSSAPPMTMFGLSPAHVLGDIARSVLESICYGIRGNLQQLQEVHGRPFDAVVLTGGASRSHLWVQMLADVLGKDVRVPVVAEAPARAGARLIVKDNPDAWPPPLPVDVYRPDPAATLAYCTFYQRYLDVHGGLRTAFGGTG